MSCYRPVAEAETHRRRHRRALLPPRRVRDQRIAVADGRLHALYRSVAVDAFDRPGWDWTTLGEIAEVKGGITKDSKRETHP